MRLLPLLLLLLTSCAGQPRTRLGALPFPGTFTLFALANPDDLGHASYEPALLSSEARGILYTRRAGFLDLAHLRESMDWSHYLSTQVAAALHARKDKLALPGTDGCAFHFYFDPPPELEALDNDRRARVIDELAARIGALAAFHAMTWHEIITWHGYRTTLVIPEERSAFSYDDTMSHLVGLRAAERARRLPPAPWNDRATEALNAELADLGVVSREDAMTAIQLVKGQWWSGGRCLKRFLELGDSTHALHPWLVRGTPWGDDTPEAFAIPTLCNIDGRDCSGAWTMLIVPTPLIPSAATRVSTRAHRAIQPDTDFPILLQSIHADMQSEFGVDFDQPYPGTPTLRVGP